MFFNYDNSHTMTESMTSEGVEQQHEFAIISHDGELPPNVAEDFAVYFFMYLFSVH